MHITYGRFIFIEHSYEQYGTEMILELGFTYTPGRDATPPAYAHGGLPPDPEENLLEAIFIKGTPHDKEHDLFELMYELNSQPGKHPGTYCNPWFDLMQERYLQEVSDAYRSRLEDGE